MISLSDMPGLLAGEVPATGTGAPESTRLDRVLAERSLYEFVQQAWPHVEAVPFTDGPHIQAVCDHLQAVSEGQIKQLLLNIPPGCSKSLITCVFWPAWEWARDPSLRWFCASYDQRLSTRDSVRCRALVSSPWYRRNWGDRFRLTDDQNQKTYYETDAGGYRLATSVGAHGTGEHPDRIIIDDPHDPIGAESESERQRTIDWWDLTMSTRGVARDVRRVIIMQRLTDNDLSAHVLKEGDWVHICLPMWYEPGRMPATPLGWNDWRTEEGQLLIPELFSEEKLAPVKKKLGVYGVAGQMQQRPSPRGGALFKRDWWNGRCRYRLENGDAIIRQAKPGVLVMSDCNFIVIVDGAASSKSTADHTAICVFAIDNDGDLYVMWVVRTRLEVEDILPVVDEVCAAWRPDWVGIEASGFQVWFTKNARDKVRYPHIPTVQELTPTDGMKQAVGAGKGKAARAATAIIWAQQGRILLPYPDDRENPWVGEFEEELYSFTGKEGREDDQVDCLAYAVLAIDQLGYGPVEELPPPDYSRRPGPFN
jgi:predicted phage terminase large subunit-like protein